MNSKIKRKRFVRKFIETVYVTRWYDEKVALKPVLSLTKKEIDELRKNN